MIWTAIQRIRRDAPLVLNLTNYVVMSTTANALLALGASPVMAHALEEVEEMAAISRAVVINLGTLSPPWVEAMVRAGATARREGIPLVLDPVGCGATTYRTRTACMLVEEVRPAVIRGNASEIRALAKAMAGAPPVGTLTKGVDSQIAPDEVAHAAHALARATGCVVSVSGPTDLIISDGAVIRVDNGHPLMTRVTGVGCTATALTGAFLTVSPTPLEGAAWAMAVTGLAGQLAEARCEGPGSFQACFLDALYGLDQSRGEPLLRLTRAELLGAR